MQMFCWRSWGIGPAALTYTHAYVYAIAKMQGIYYFITLPSISVSDHNSCCSPDPHFPISRPSAVVSRAIRSCHAINQRSRMANASCSTLVLGCVSVMANFWRPTTVLMWVSSH